MALVAQTFRSAFGRRGWAGLKTCATVAALSIAVSSQTLPSATNVAALAEFPAFFQGKTIVVRGDLTSADGRFSIGDDGAERVISLAAGSAGLSEGRRQVRGVFWDIGRLTPDDARVTPSLRTLLTVQGEQWPRPGEVLAIEVDSVTPADTFPAPSVRSIALEPQRYTDQRVTIRGQFRGRNLFGDLPASPASSRWDFVIRSADASVWVTGLRPRGKNFDLDINARVDTNRWLEVSGLVRRKGGLVWIEGSMIELTQAATDASATPAAVVPVQGPPAKVVFSLPTQGETDVDAGVVVRIQLSRDPDPATIADRVRVSYQGQAQGGGGDLPAAPAFQVSYARGSRVLEIRFKAPLEPSRTVVIELMEGMKAPDGAPVEPYTLRFTVGPD